MRSPPVKPAADGRQRRMTINDIARLAAVSKKTVSRVINASPFVREETRVRVAGVIAAHGFTPDPQARGLAFRKSFLVGVIYDNPNAQFIVNFQYGILDGVRGSGFEIIVHPCDRRSSSFLLDVRTFVERQKLYGVIILPPVSENETLVAMLREMGVSYVRVASAQLDEPAHMVSSNDRIATADAARHLVELGHERIAVIRGPEGYRSADERWAGFHDELVRLGQDLSPDYVLRGGYTYESGIDCAERLLAMEPRPTAIFVSNDEMAAGVYHVANLRGISIPGDLSVVGFDDMPLAARMWPPLTTVTWPIREMGRLAARQLVGEAGSKPPGQGAPMATHLTVRASTATPAA